MSDIEPYAEPTAPTTYPDNGVLQGSLDRELLAAHFQGYELEPLITVTLNTVELVTPPAQVEWSERPIATRSGLIRLSSVGPVELNPVRIEAELTAPTVMMFLA